MHIQIVIKSTQFMYIYTHIHAGCLATLDTADEKPHKDPPRTEEADDKVEEMVGRIPLNHCGVYLDMSKGDKLLQNCKRTYYM